jgi:transposase
MAVFVSSGGLANKLARVCYAIPKDHTSYGNPQPRQENKLTGTAFAIAA